MSIISNTFRITKLNLNLIIIKLFNAYYESYIAETIILETHNVLQYKVFLGSNLHQNPWAEIVSAILRK